MQAIKLRHPDVEFIGVGGARMEAEGLTSYFPMERLAVMGLVEVLGRLFELLGRRRQLARDLIAAQPDVFIGIDAPDFNLGLELKLRRAGIRTVHYVSPSVWAWRQKRVLKIREACDLMLTLFPFEAQFYDAHQVPVRFVGHPLADAIPQHADRAAARDALDLPHDEAVVALMPGSRGGEVARLGELFLDAAIRLRALRPGIRFLLPCATPERREQLEQMLADLGLSMTEAELQELMAAMAPPEEEEGGLSSFAAASVQYQQHAASGCTSAPCANGGLCQSRSTVTALNGHGRPCRAKFAPRS